MRPIGLSIIAFILIAGTASAEDRLPRKMEFVHEPEGQAFSPPQVRIEYSGPNSTTFVERVTALAKSNCADEVAGIYSYRKTIYMACLRRKLEPSGFTVTDPSDASQVARRYGVELK